MLDIDFVKATPLRFYHVIDEFVTLQRKRNIQDVDGRLI